MDKTLKDWHDPQYKCLTCKGYGLVKQVLSWEECEKCTGLGIIHKGLENAVLCRS